MLPTDRLPITIDGTPQPLLLHWMNGHEELGSLFEYTLEIYSEKADLAFDALLGKPMTVCLSRQGGNRFFNGIITRLWRVGTTGRYLVFRAVLSPKMWLLRRTTDCRIYQKKTVPEVVKEVLREHAITFSDRLQNTAYGKWDYLTQYRESDFAFISRIMEREGIYYYFKHTQAAHEMVLSDALGSHDPREKYEQIPIWPPGTAQTDRDHFTGWRQVHGITSIGITLQAHDFRLRRGANIKALAGTAAEHEQDEFHLYDYAGHYVGAQNQEAGDAGSIRQAGEHYARVQLDEQRSDLERLQAEGNVRGLETGALFQLDDLTAPTDKFLVVATDHELRNASFESSNEGVGEHEICRVTCSAINSKRQFRPNRTTDRPVVAGPESAIVVGPPGQEIHTDKHGRVRIQFHWDREGHNNESSTCWVRVGQMWAGANWGSIYIPRIGHEVIVQFMGGDPDRPIITGSVYNADNPPPYALPANATQSGIKSRSSKGGGPSNFNEIRFEDKKGSEQVYLQAEKDLEILVKHDEHRLVDHDRMKDVTNDETTTVGGNRTETVQKDETITIHGNRTETVDKNEDITIGGNRTETVSKAEMVTVVLTRTHDVGAAESLSVGGSRSVSVGGSESKTVGGGQSLDVTKDQTISITGGRTLDITKDDNVTITGKWTEKITKDGALTVGKKLLIDAADEITLKSGKSSIVLKKDGTIIIKGKDVSIDASGKVNVKATGDVIIKGSKIAQN